jgi:hypothetical protein
MGTRKIAANNRAWPRKVVSGLRNEVMPKHNKGMATIKRKGHAEVA